MGFIATTNHKDRTNITLFQDVGSREDQQDRFVLARLQGGMLLAVADGHGGHAACSLIAKHLQTIFSQELEQVSKGTVDKDLTSLKGSQLKDVMKETVSRLIALTKDMLSGSTLTIAFVERGYCREGCTPATRITLAQIGDSILAISPVEGVFLTTSDHTARLCKKDVLDIQKRFKKQYGQECKVSQNYLYSSPNSNGGLALTRALGDAGFTLVREAEINCYTLPSENLVLFIASDGVLTSERTKKQTVKNIIQKIREGNTAAMIGSAIKPMDDNVTLICLE